MEVIYFKNNEPSQKSTRMRNSCIACQNRYTSTRRKKYCFECIKYKITLNFSRYSSFNHHFIKYNDCPVKEI
jgi:hypothetical protein